MTNPILVEVTRGGRQESAHRGAYCVIDADGAVVASAGDIDRPVFPRSAVKPFQALPFVETGAFDDVGADPSDLALACGSHSGEPAHAERASALLGRIGASEDDLVCAAHWPFNEGAHHGLVRAGLRPTRCHNNCSGKHAAFLATARRMSLPWAGYHTPSHPLQREIAATLTEALQYPVETMSGTDGCGIPAHAAPVRALASGFARFGAERLANATQNAAARRMRAAASAAPHMIGGADRFDTRILTIFGARVFIKAGAEGVHCAAIPRLGLGVAIKIDDGAARAAEVAMAALIEAHLDIDEAAQTALAPLRRPPVKSWDGAIVGDVRAVL